MTRRADVLHGGRHHGERAPFAATYSLGCQNAVEAVLHIQPTALSSLPALEDPCQDCDGKVKIDTRREGNAIHFGGPCNTCRVVAMMPTAAGQQIITLMRHQRQKGAF